MTETRFKPIQSEGADLCHVVKDGVNSQAIASNTNTPITWPVEVFDTNAMHDNVTNNTRITIKKSGYYMITAAIRWTTTAVTQGGRKIQLNKNGNEIRSVWQPNLSTISQHELSQTISTIEYLSENDYLEVIAWHYVGAPLNIDPWPSTCYFAVAKIA